MIRKIQEESGAKIDIEDDGSVNISAVSGESMQTGDGRCPRLDRRGRGWSHLYWNSTTPGGLRLLCRNSAGKEGLVRTSQLADYQVMRPEDVVSVGDEITVMVIEVDPQGRVNLSRRAALSGEMPSAAELEHERTVAAVVVAVVVVLAVMVIVAGWAEAVIVAVMETVAAMVIVAGWAEAVIVAVMGTAIITCAAVVMVIAGVGSFGQRRPMSGGPGGPRGPGGPGGRGNAPRRDGNYGQRFRSPPGKNVIRVV